MGTRTNSKNTETVAKVTKPPRCSICREIIKPTCDWRQGRCPHIPSLAEQITSNPYKTRFYNLIKIFLGKR